MDYSVIVYFNERGKKLIEKSRKTLRLDCWKEEIESCIYEMIPESLIERYEVKADFSIFSMEETLVKVVQEEDPGVSYFGEILGMDYKDDLVKVYIYDLGNEICFKVATGKGKYYKHTYTIQHIEDSEELKKATEKMIEIRKIRVKDIKEKVNETLTLSKLNKILKDIQS